MGGCLLHLRPVETELEGVSVSERTQARLKPHFPASAREPRRRVRRKKAAVFRELLLEDGYKMIEFRVHVRAFLREPRQTGTLVCSTRFPRLRTGGGGLASADTTVVTRS
jgi:hypothetical protein